MKVTNTISTSPSRYGKLSAGLAVARKQLGGMMIESLVGLLILSLIGGGVMHATARMANTRQQQTINNIAVNQMRSLLMTRATATGADLCSGTHSLSIPGQTEPAALTVKGCGNTDVKIKDIKIDIGGATTTVERDLSSMRPVVLEVGSEADLIRVGGEEVQSIATD